MSITSLHSVIVGDELCLLDLRERAWDKLDFQLFMGAEVSPWGWKLHARLILGSQQAVPIVQGQILKAMWVASS